MRTTQIKPGCIQSLPRAARQGSLADQRTVRQWGTYRKIPPEITSYYFPTALRLHTHTRKGELI